MYYYCVSFRLDTDPDRTKRYWEGYAHDRDDMISNLVAYVQNDITLFNNLVLIKVDEYLSFFK